MPGHTFMCSPLPTALEKHVNFPGTNSWKRVVRSGTRFLALVARKFQLVPDCTALTPFRVILDARLGCEIRKGYAITVILMTEDLISRVRPPPMQLRDLPSLRTRVDTMRDQCPRIRLNFAFGDRQGTTVDDAALEIND